MWYNGGRRKINFLQNFGGKKVKERVSLEYQVVDGRIIIQMISIKCDRISGLNSSASG
jgi:hypothetical protein